jgi:drug/metabolite transporter (DMT)-like permease
LLDHPEALALCASFFFGLGLVLTQFGLRHLPPGLGAMISIPMLTSVLWLLAPLLLDLRGWEPRAAAIFVAVGLLYPVVVTLLTFEANRRMGPGVAGALGNLAPVFAVILAAFLFSETPRLVQAFGIALIVLGVVLLSARRGRGHENSWPFWVAALPIGASMIRGVVQPVAKIGLALWPSPFAALLLGYTASSLVAVSVATIRAGRWPSGFRRRGVFWFCVVGLSNGTAVLALYAALARGSVTSVAPLAATYPLMTLALSAVLFRTERIGRSVIAGIATTVVGVIMLVGT